MVFMKESRDSNTISIDQIRYEDIILPTNLPTESSSSHFTYLRHHNQNRDALGVMRCNCG